MGSSVATPVRARPARAGTRRGTGYVAALDGIRALAVAAVLAFHGGLAWARGGFLGVDAFFVLSGYLITSLLLAERRSTGHIALMAFWGRRARRLLPALLLLVATVAVCARGFLPPEEVRLLRGDGLAALFYVANWRMVLRGGDYFAQTAAPSPLQHTWSLGIEEQFYLLWPLLLVVLLRRGSLRTLLCACVGGAVVSAAGLALLYHPDDPGRAYYGTDTRAASLLVGAALATLLAMRSERVPDRAQVATPPRRFGLAALALLAAAATGWAWTHLSGGDAPLYRGGMAAAALAVAAVIAHVALVPDGVSARVLSLPPLPALGRISYGIYLWHWPVFIAANADRTGLHGLPLFALRCSVTLLIATASYLLLERPVRSRRLLRRGGVAVAGAVGAVAAAVGLVVASTAVAALPGQPVAAPKTDGIDRVTRPASPAAERRTASPAAGPTRHVHHVSQGEPVVVDVFGDSVAWSLVTYLPRHRGLDVRDRTMLGCGVTATAPYRYFGSTFQHTMRKCRQWPRLWRRAVAGDDPDVALVLVGRWETMDRVLHGRWTHVGEPAFDEHLTSRLERATAIAGSHGAKVLLATEPYNRRGERPDGGLFPEDRPERVTAWNRLLRSVAARHPDVGVLDFGGRVSPEGRFSWTAGGVRVRADGLHLSPEGVRYRVAPWLFPRLLGAAPR